MLSWRAPGRWPIITDGLVSVILPCYNHAATLPWALASLVAQTHPDWECTVVDDGSADAPGEVVERYQDPRIHYHRLAENRGRGAARQVALERARGPFVAFLDADDWLYPWRFEAQLACFADSSELAAVGTGMAIVDGANRLLGLRGCTAADGVDSGQGALPATCGKATIMLRGGVARSGRFDAGHRWGEDRDYLNRVLEGRPYRILPAPLYAYRQETSGTAARSRRAHALRRQQARDLARQRPIPHRARMHLLESSLKMAAYGAAELLGLDRWVAGSRNTAADEPRRREFERARAAVAAAVVPSP